MCVIKNYRKVAFHIALMVGATCSFLGVFTALLIGIETLWLISIALAGFAIGMSCGEPLTNLFFLTPSKRKLVSAEIAKSGPALFDLVMSRKLSNGSVGDPLGTRTYITEPTFNPYHSLEQKDLQAAIRIERYSSTEIAILQYISDNISSIGHRIGYTLLACGNHGTSVEYYAVNREEIALLGETLRQFKSTRA